MMSEFSNVRTFVMLKVDKIITLVNVNLYKRVIDEEGDFGYQKCSDHHISNC